MTVELLKRKYPIGTRVKIKQNSFIFGESFVMATVVGHAENEIETKGDDNYTRWLMIGHDQFSVIYNEKNQNQKEA